MRCARWGRLRRARCFAHRHTGIVFASLWRMPEQTDPFKPAQACTRRQRRRQQRLRACRAPRPALRKRRRPLARCRPTTVAPLPTMSRSSPPWSTAQSIKPPLTRWPRASTGCAPTAFCEQPQPQPQPRPQPTPPPQRQQQQQQQTAAASRSRSSRRARATSRRQRQRRRRASASRHRAAAA